MCGSMILDKHFKDFLIKLVGMNNWEALPDLTKTIILNRWTDEIKTHYEGPDTSEDYLDTGGFIPLPGIPDIPEKTIEGGMFYMEKYISELPAKVPFINPSIARRLKKYSVAV